MARRGEIVMTTPSSVTSILATLSGASAGADVTTTIGQAAEDKGKRSEPKPADKPAEDRPRQDNGGAQIVSLDAFRKK